MDEELTVNTVENPEIAVEDEGFALVVGEGDESEGDKTAELEAQNAELQAKLTAATAVPVVPNDGFAELAAEIRKIAPAPAAPAVPQETNYEEFLKQKGVDFYKDPALTSAAIAAQIVQDSLSPAQAQIEVQAAQISKLTLLNTPGESELYIRYKDEIEAFALESKSKGTSYQDAMKVVKANHIDDLIADQVTAKLAEATKQAEVNAAQGSAPLPLDVSSMARKPAAKQIRISQQQWNTMEKWSLIKGFDLGTTKSPGTDQSFVIDHMRKLGVIK